MMRNPIRFSILALIAVSGLLVSLHAARENSEDAALVSTKTRNTPQTCKMDAGLSLRFVEPSQIIANKSLSMTLHIDGEADERCRVSFYAGPEVSLSRQIVDVELDANGQSTLDLNVMVPAPDGCQVLARVERDDGRQQEISCSLGRAQEPPRNFRSVAGRRVRIDR